MELPIQIGEELNNLKENHPNLNKLNGLDKRHAWRMGYDDGAINGWASRSKEIEELKTQQNMVLLVVIVIETVSKILLN